MCFTIWVGLTDWNLSALTIFNLFVKVRISNVSLLFQCVNIFRDAYIWGIFKGHYETDIYGAHSRTAGLWKQVEVGYAWNGETVPSVRELPPDEQECGGWPHIPAHCHSQWTCHSVRTVEPGSEGESVLCVSRWRGLWRNDRRRNQ